MSSLLYVEVSSGQRNCIAKISLQGVLEHDIQWLAKLCFLSSSMKFEQIWYKKDNSTFCRFGGTIIQSNVNLDIASLRETNSMKRAICRHLFIFNYI